MTGSPWADLPPHTARGLVDVLALVVRHEKTLPIYGDRLAALEIQLADVNARIAAFSSRVADLEGAQ